MHGAPSAFNCTQRTTHAAALCAVRVAQVTDALPGLTERLTEWVSVPGIDVPPRPR